MASEVYVLFIGKSEAFQGTFLSTSPYTSCQTTSHGISNHRGHWEEGAEVFMTGSAFDQLRSIAWLGPIVTHMKPRLLVRKEITGTE